LKLRTRIAVTFLLLLAAVLGAALGVVFFENQRYAELDVRRQLDLGAQIYARALEANRRLLAQAALAAGADYGFRQALALRDTDTLESALENNAQRIHAPTALVTSLDGRVLAAYGSTAAAGSAFPVASLLKAAGSRETNSTVMVDSGHIYQVVAARVRSPLPVAWIVMGFELDADGAKDLARITGLAVTLSIHSAAGWRDVVTAASVSGNRAADMVSERIVLSARPGMEVAATLSGSLGAARAPFRTLTVLLVVIAVVSLAAAAGVIFWLARGITRPLSDLTAAVGQIRDGRYDVPVTVQRRDELGLLAEGLEVMQAAVRSRDDSISRLAYRDTLTGLINRTAFAASLARALAAASGPLAVAMINLHQFRRINEHLGYAVGDEVLKQIALRLTGPDAPAPAVARLAADQFAAFAPLEGPMSLESWGAALLRRLAEPIVVERQPIDISAMVGLALAPVDAASADELMRCADLAVERARREKRPLARFRPDRKPSSRDQLSLLGELRRAIEQDELCMFFQPKIELSSNRVAGAEVLLRWRHPVRGLLGPAAFLPFAEQTGFIRSITRWTLERAVAQGAAWYRSGTPLPLAVNVSAEDIAQLRFDLRVARALARHELPPSLLTLELTESGFIADPEQALAMLDGLSSLGVNLSIDDFGTGYSSLSHLARMPVQEVKIDRSFVQGLESDDEFATVVRSAIEMGHGLGLKVVAEGIETETAAARLREMGCDVAQGYLFARPMPLAELEAWLLGRDRVPVVANPADFAIQDLTDTAVLTI
jgi:diguanylate cyclase (GGDEF)-like protein